MKILDKYILKKFLTIFFLSMIAFLVIFNIVDLIEKIDRFIRHNMSLSSVLLFYYYQLPYYIDLIIPISLLLASVFTMGGLIKNNELAAIKSSGISLYRVCTPLLILGLLFSLLSFFFQDNVVIPASRKRIELESNDMKRYSSRNKKVFVNITRQDSPDCNIIIGKFRLKTNRASQINVQIMENHKLKTRIDAETMLWLPDQKVWRMLNLKMRTFDSRGNETAYVTKPDSIFHFNLRPDDLIRENYRPEEMRFSELAQFINRLKTSGNDPTKWEVNLQYKAAFPLTCFIVVLFGLPISAMKRTNSAGFGAGVSLAVIFIYYGVAKFGQVLGFNSILSPFMGAWLGNFIFLSIGLNLFLKIRQ